MYAVAAVLPELGFLRSGLVKLCAAVGMCLLSFGAGRYLARLTAAFCAMGCVFAGAVTAFTQLTGTGLMRVPGDGYYPVSALALCAIGALCVAVCRLFFSACQIFFSFQNSFFHFGVKPVIGQGQRGQAL